MIIYIGSKVVGRDSMDVLSGMYGHLEVRTQVINLFLLLYVCSLLQVLTTTPTAGRRVVHVRYVEPIEEGDLSGKKFEFKNMMIGQAIPSNFIPSIEKGFIEAANS